MTPLARAAVLVGVLVGGWSALAVGVWATDAGRTTADEPQYLLSARSLWQEHDLDISDELAERDHLDFHAATLPRQTEPRPDGSEISPHDPLLPVLLAVPVGLGGATGAKLTLAALAGVLAAVLVVVAVRRFDVDVTSAAIVVGAFGLAAPLSSYGTQVYPELPAALAVTAAIAALSGGLSRRALALLVVALVALPWLAVKYVGVAAVLGLIALVRLVRAGRHRDLAGVLLAVGAAGVVYLVGHRLLYGGWTVYAAGDHFVERGEASAMGFAPDYWGRSRRLVGLLVDRGFGLAAWAPLYLLAVPALGALARRRPRNTAVLLAPLAAGWLTATYVAVTMHGWWWPGRQVVVVLPTIVLAVAWWAGRTPWVKVAVVVLGAISAWFWGWVVAEAAFGQLRLVVDFEATSDPLVRGWRVLLPDGRSTAVADQLLTVAWIGVVAGLAVLGWRRAPADSGGDQDAVAGELADADALPVDLDGHRAVGRRGGDAAADTG